MRPLILGQSPSRRMSPGDRPFNKTPALTRLASYCGEPEPERLYDVFDFMNLVDTYPGPNPSNSKFDFKPSPSSLRLEEIHRSILAHQRVVILGAVGRDLILGNKHRHSPFVWINLSTVPAVQITWSPHPGGTSFWWNNPDNKAKGIQFWHALYADLQVPSGDV